MRIRQNRTNRNPSRSQNDGQNSAGSTEPSSRGSGSIRITASLGSRNIEIRNSIESWDEALEIVTGAKDLFARNVKFSNEDNDQI